MLQGFLGRADGVLEFNRRQALGCGIHVLHRLFHVGDELLDLLILVVELAGAGALGQGRGLFGQGGLQFTQQ